MLIKEYFEDVYNRIIERKGNYEKTCIAVGEHFADIYTFIWLITSTSIPCNSRTFRNGNICLPFLSPMWGVP